MGEDIAKLIPNYTYSNPIDAISTYCYEFSRVKLIEELVKSLNIDSTRPGLPHKAFCELPFDIVCTTNFDFLIEKAYEIENKYCRPVISGDQLSITNSKKEVILVKFHGDLHHPESLVVTEHDYDTFIEKNPILATYFGNLLITKTPLFIGYSLDDPDFRQIWQVIGERLGKMRRPAYVLTVGIDALNEKKYERRGVKVVNLPGKINNYGTILETFFNNLRAYWPSNAIKESDITDEDTLSELSLPKESANRLVYFSIPFNLLSYYKSYVFPIVESFGFVPVSPENVILSGDNIRAKILALIDRSQIFIADMSNRVGQTEVGIALSRKPVPPTIMLIKEENYELPSGIADMSSVSRPADLTSINDDFLSEFENLFKSLTATLINQFDKEPQRLLNKKEYRAAVISVVTLFETELNATTFFAIIKKPLTLQQMIKVAREKDLLDENDAKYITIGIAFRNRLIHTDYSITPRKARQIVDNIMRIINTIKRLSENSMF
jgi:uncharacterized protein YutE (UPF0331/DUF86 family)